MIALVASLLLAASPPQDAGSLGPNWNPNSAEVRAQVRAGRIIPFTQAIRSVQARVPGHLLDGGLEDGDNGRPTWRVRWAAADGRRLDVIVDAASGAVLRQEGK